MCLKLWWAKTEQKIWTHETISGVRDKQEPISILIGSEMPLDNSRNCGQALTTLLIKQKTKQNLLSGYSFKFVDLNRMEVICNKWRSYQLI